MGKPSEGDKSESPVIKIGTLIVATLTLIATFVTIWLNTCNFNKSLESNTKNFEKTDQLSAKIYELSEKNYQLSANTSERDMVLKDIDVLKSTIEDAKEWIQLRRIGNENTKDLESKLEEADGLRVNATAAWQNRNYGETDRFIQKAYKLIGEIQPKAFPPVASFTDVVTPAGVFTQSITTKSADGGVVLLIIKGTVGKTKESTALSVISVTPLTISPPLLSTNSSLIGLSYSLEPDGATFNPPINVILTYDPTAIPQFINENDLVVAYYEKANNIWVRLEDSIVDTVNHSVSVRASHFTPFAIMGTFSPWTVITPPPPPPPPPPPVAGLAWWIWLVAGPAAVIMVVLVVWLAGLARRRTTG